MDRLEKTEKMLQEKILMQRQAEEKMLMNRLNNQLNLSKIRKQRDAFILGNLPEEIEDNTDEDIYTVVIDEDGEIEVNKKDE